MQLRAENRAELYAILDAIFITRTTESWISILDATGTASADVLTIDKVFEDPQVLHRDMLLTAEHTSLGTVPQVGHAQKFSRNPAEIRLAPPLLGEHTCEVLQQVLGLTDCQLHGLEERAVIFGQTHENGFAVQTSDTEGFER